MRILFFSDLHGSASSAELLLERAAECRAELLVFLGDALYHGPRNPFPDGYAPQKAAEILNRAADKIIAIRGNCDSEVDQMLLGFPLMADYSLLADGSRRFFLTHGHLWNAGNPPSLPPGGILAHGHTHIPEIKTASDGIPVFNPGSAALPKQNFPASFGFWDGAELSVRTLTSNQVMMCVNTETP